MKLFPDGDRIFEVISRYDDLLTLEERDGYEPGDTLALIVPFLVSHDITEKHITDLSARASFTGGAQKLVGGLIDDGWKVCCITTTYEQYALHITNKLGIYAHNVACTPFPLDKMRQALCKDDLALLRQAEVDILTMRPIDDDARIKRGLDEFFWERLPSTGMGELIKQVKPIGGRRKAEALQRFAEKYNEPPGQWMAVGDSITDFRMFQLVEGAGGVAVAFNANEYALPYATIGLASTDISDLADVLAAWKKGQRQAVEKMVKSREKAGGQGDRGNFQWLANKPDIQEAITLHKGLRQTVREAAGRLG